MTWFEQLEIHLSDLYRNNLSHDVDAFKHAFYAFFGEEHQTLRFKMFHNLDQLRLLFERENLHEVNAKNCLEVLGTQFKEFFATQGVNSSNHLHQCWNKISKITRIVILKPTYVLYSRTWTYLKISLIKSKDVQINPFQTVDASLVVMESSGIESINNRSKNALSKLVNETQMQMQEGKVDIGKALDVGLVVTESSGTKSDKQDTSSRSKNDTHAEDVVIKPVNDKEPFAEV
ncbi:hypothetical protein Tco_0603524 [Tanacetum coccineum]